jgi:hypothetical protein
MLRQDVQTIDDATPGLRHKTAFAGMTASVPTFKTKAQAANGARPATCVWQVCVSSKHYGGVAANFMFNKLCITRGELNVLNEPPEHPRVYSVTPNPGLGCFPGNTNTSVVPIVFSTGFYRT